MAVSSSVRGGISVMVFVMVFHIQATAQKALVKDLPFKKEHEGANINKIYQDDDGLLWLGTTSGLFRYDGHSFDQYLLPDSITNNEITSISQTKNKQLWVGYKNGNIAVLNNHHLQLLAATLGSVPITGILEDKDGVMWVATYGEGMFYKQNDQFININLDDGLNDNFIYVMVEDTKGRKWAGTDRGIGICHLENGMPKIRILSTKDGLKDNIVKTITSDEEGNLFIGLYENGFCKYNLGKEAIEDQESYPSWPFGPINDVEVIQNNEIWLATERHGIFAFDFESFGLTRVMEIDEFKNAKALSLLKDQEGNVWFSDNVSNLKIADPRFKFHHEFNNNQHEINSFATDPQGNIWYAGKNSIIKYNPNTLRNQVTQFPARQLPDPEKVISTYLDDHGFLWLGTYEAGVFRFDPATASLVNINESDGLVNNNVLSINGHQSEIWFATLGGVSRCSLSNATNPDKPTFQFDNFDQEGDLGTNYIYQVFIDSKGRAWFATHGKGIAVYDKGVIRQFGGINDLSSNVIYSITEDAKGNIWFSTANGELYQYNEVKFRNHTPLIGQQKKAISSIIGDKYGNLIIVFADGIGLLDEFLNYHDFRSSLGTSFTNSPLNATDQDQQGNIWISMQQALIKFQQHEAPYQSSPTVFVDNIAVFFENVDVEPNHQFSYNQDHLTFYCRSTWYQNIEEISYEYMLVGFDLDWKVSRDNHFTYPKLPSGDYSFKVKTTLNGQSRAPNLAQFDFTIVAPIWKRPWFYSVVILSVTLGLFYYIKSREQRLKQSERMQKDVIEFQFQTLKSQINPHFLFNSFNTLIAIIEENQSVAVDYVSKLSDFFRHVLTYRDKQIIDLEEELKLMNDYFFLQQKRYGNNFNIVVNVSERAKKNIYYHHLPCNYWQKTL